MYYGKRRGFRKVAVTTPRKGKYTPRRKNYNKKPKVSFTKKVQAIISRNNENKFTSTLTTVNPVALSSPLGPFNFFVWSPGQDVVNYRLFNLPVGAGEGQRIGNTIKLKRWIIKGVIHPKANVNSDVMLINAYIGYVDIYFGKYLKTNAPISPTLGALYQNGGTTTTPSAKCTDMLMPVNKDLYKVYYHRRFKMGAASDVLTYAGTLPSVRNAANNDFMQEELTLEEYNSKIIKFYLNKYNNNVLQVADKLDVGKSTIYRMIKEGRI